MCNSLAVFHRVLSTSFGDSNSVKTAVCVSSILGHTVITRGSHYMGTPTHHLILYACLSNNTFTVAHENRTNDGKPNIGSTTDFSQPCVFGSKRGVLPSVHKIQGDTDVPLGYPLPAIFSPLFDGW